jgi:hypothetical protein
VRLTLGGYLIPDPARQVIRRPVAMGGYRAFAPQADAAAQVVSDQPSAARSARIRNGQWPQAAGQVPVPARPPRCVPVSHAGLLR